MSRPGGGRAGLRLTIVGCAGSFPGPESPASAYLVEAPDAAGRVWRVMLDLGSGSLGPLQRFVAPRDLDAVLLSHLHPDHCLDVCPLYVALRYDPRSPARDERLPVYGPDGTLDRLNRAYATEGDGHLEGLLDVRPWRDGEPVRIGPLLVTPYRVEHPVQTYGLRVRTEDGAVLAYSGDTDLCPALVRLADGADVLLCEASAQEGRETYRGVHLTGRRAGRAAAEAGARRLVLTHVPAWTDPQVVSAEARQVYRGPVELARPGAVHVVARPDL